MYEKALQAETPEAAEAPAEKGPAQARAATVPAVPAVPAIPDVGQPDEPSSLEIYVEITIVDSSGNTVIGASRVKTLLWNQYLNAD